MVIYRYRTSGLFATFSLSTFAHTRPAPPRTHPRRLPHQSSCLPHRCRLPPPQLAIMVSLVITSVNMVNLTPESLHLNEIVTLLDWLTIGVSAYYAYLLLRLRQRRQSSFMMADFVVGRVASYNISKPKQATFYRESYELRLTYSYRSPITNQTVLRTESRTRRQTSKPLIVHPGMAVIVAVFKEPIPMASVFKKATSQEFVL